MPRQRPPVDKSLGATVRLLTLPVLLAVFVGYFAVTNWYGEYRANAVCDQARTSRSADEFRARLQAEGAPWSEGPWAPGETQFVIMYPGSMIDLYNCSVHARGDRILEIEVRHVD